MHEQSAIISLTRKKTAANMLRQFTITIDDKAVGKIKTGQSKQFRVPCGKHAVRVKLDFYKSKQLLVDLKPDEILVLECGDQGPESMGETFSLKGIDKSIHGLLSPNEYLYVKLLNESSAIADKSEDMQSHKTSKTSQPKRVKKKIRSIFVSYRREDSREITGRVCDRLIAEFGKDTVFRDVDSIPAGVDFRDHINKTIGHCSVLVAIIGNHWLDAKNRKGELRLTLPDDPIKVEIETALSNDIPVIPVLVKNSEMPEEEELPEGMKALAYRNAIIIPREPYFHAGVDLLINELKHQESNEAEEVNAVRPESRHYCIHCGSEITPGNKFCIQCGKPV